MFSCLFPGNRVLCLGGERDELDALANVLSQGRSHVLLTEGNPAPGFVLPVAHVTFDSAPGPIHASVDSARRTAGVSGDLNLLALKIERNLIANSEEEIRLPGWHCHFDLQADGDEDATGLITVSEIRFSGPNL